MTTLSFHININSQNEDLAQILAGENTQKICEETRGIRQFFTNSFIKKAHTYFSSIPIRTCVPNFKVQ